MSYESRLDLVTTALGRYFNIASKDQMLTMLLSNHDAVQQKDRPMQAGKDFRFHSFDPKPEFEKVANMFQNRVIGGTTVAHAAKTFQTIIDEQGNPIKDTVWSAKEKDAASQCFKFVGEPDKFNTKVGGETAFSDVSVSSMVLMGSAEGDDTFIVNSKFDKPDREAPNLTAVCVFPVHLSPSTRDTGTCSLFINSIPTIEFSKAVPFLDVQVLSPVKSLNSNNTIQSLSLMQFLLGGVKPDGGTANAHMASALPMVASDVNLLKQISAKSATNAKEKKAILESQISSAAGMELFLSPQTLVNAYETHHEQGINKAHSAKTSGNDSGNRSAAVIDRFRPFLTLESFKCDVANTRGLMSYRTGELTFTLHDRSRLGEIAAFVKPDLFGSTELMITYGWSHPDGSGPVPFDNKGQLTGAAGNLFGIYLDSQKTTEKYKVTNSSFSFDEVGQVNVTLSLATSAADDVNTKTIGAGSAAVDKKIKVLKELTDAIDKYRRTLSNIPGQASKAKDTKSEGTVLSTSSDVQRALMVTDDVRKKIRSFIRTHRNNTNPDMKKVRNALIKLYGKNAQKNTGQVAAVKSTIAAAVSDKVTACFGLRDFPNPKSKSGSSSNMDPFARTFTGFKGSTQYVNIKADAGNYVSLGALLMQFIGVPLASTGRYNEVQFIFYAFNDRASYVRGANISEFPISFTNFLREFKKITKTSANIPIGRFLSFLNANFISSQKANVYGLKNLYTANKKNEYVLKTKAIIQGMGVHTTQGVQTGPAITVNLQESSTILMNEKKKRLVDCYGEGNDQTVKMPKIRMHLETVRITDPEVVKEQGNTGTVLRIHLYDARATPYTAMSELLEAGRSSAMRIINISAREAIKSAKDIKAARKTGDGLTELVTQIANAGHAESFANGINAALEAGLIEPIHGVIKPQKDGLNPSELKGKRFRIKGGFPALKNFVKRSMPSITYGTSNSAVLGASVASMQSSRLSTINIVNSSLGDGTTAQGARDTGLPLQVAPTSLSMELIGCPSIAFGQHYFVDFGTGTTVDNVYIVTEVSHELKSGEYRTSVVLHFDSTYGTYRNMMSNIEKALDTIGEIVK